RPVDPAGRAGRHRGVDGHRRRAGRLHQGAPRAHAGDPALLRAVAGVPPPHGLRADRLAEIRRYYRAADFCMVTSLHDGMNLVAKEYVAARDDDEGALILSRFTGASLELTDALLVNPYDVEQMAD